MSALLGQAASTNTANLSEPVPPASRTATFTFAAGGGSSLQRISQLALYGEATALGGTGPVCTFVLRCLPVVGDQGYELARCNIQTGRLGAAIAVDPSVLPGILGGTLQVVSTVAGTGAADGTATNIRARIGHNGNPGDVIAGNWV